MAFSCFYKTLKKEAVNLIVIPLEKYADWLNQQDQSIQNCINAQKFKAAAGKTALLFKSDGVLSAALVVMDINDMWSMASICQSIPHEDYQIVDPFGVVESELFYLGFGLGCYQFLSYKSQRKSNSIKLYLPKKFAEVEKMLKAIYLVRDVINTPAEDMGPEEIAHQVQKLAQTFSASFSEIVGDALVERGYRGIHTVGRASIRSPRLIRLDWGNKTHPHIVLVGKGVAFDTGGLDIKTAGSMLLMHKDMGGAAQVLGLARLIMDSQLPIRLTVLIPAVENAISGNAYRPSDVIKMYNGSTVEITNTDAEGRVILADALTEGSRLKPDLIMDFATLTGAARVAVGTEIAAFFANNEMWAAKLTKAANKVQDPVWRLPLYQPYKKLLDSKVADIQNCASAPYAGSISAALFLESFVEGDIPWLHFDLMAWNITHMPGRPVGGEAMGIRAVYEMLKAQYQQD
ncbi:leucyl aminopeptidase family protein [Caedibacter taeniospiralis]|jgi:leucyl aminopeptidase|uniref:leucyl aminopeptidase family protein n=1 Tax=Caedibacter taeniospiralis TaxID=28907 RepID=UPI0037C12025